MFPPDAIQQSANKIEEVNEAYEESDRVNHRIAFLRKTYFLVSIQLAVVTILLNITTKNTDFASTLQNWPVFFFWIPLILIIALMLLTFLLPNSFPSPLNWITYVIFLISAAFFFSFVEAKDPNDQWTFYIFFVFTHLAIALFLHVLFSKTILTF